MRISGSKMIAYLQSNGRELIRYPVHCENNVGIQGADKSRNGGSARREDKSVGKERRWPTSPIRRHLQIDSDRMRRRVLKLMQGER
jgi:hypothetical protein